MAKMQWQTANLHALAYLQAGKIAQNTMKTSVQTVIAVKPEVFNMVESHYFQLNNLDFLLDPPIHYGVYL